MPLYEFQCRDCGHHFEHLMRGGAEARCPACQSLRLERTLSVFAVSTRSMKDGAAFPAASCGTCGDPRGPGSCSMN